MKSMMTVLFGMTLCVNALFGQDVITKINGSEIKVKVIEMNADMVKYKDYNNSSDSVYTISKNEVFMIKYENGSKTIVSHNIVDNSNNLSKDTLVMIKRQIYDNHMHKLKDAQIFDLMLDHPEAYSYMKKAKPYKIAQNVLISVGVVMTFGACVMGKYSLNTGLVLLGAGLGFEVIGLCIGSGYKKNAKTALRLYNDDIHGIKSSTSWNIKVGSVNGGIGMAILF